MERKIYSKLVEWKERKNRKPLILRGARQVGKSTLASYLGKTYKYFIKLNLELYTDAKLFHQAGSDVKEVLNAILFEKNLPYDPENTLLFIDEIQEEPNAISLLRYFYEEIPSLHVIAAGSLLEFAMSEVSSFPVGRIEQLLIHPLSFEEFLMALGENKALEYFHQIPSPAYASNKLFNLFHEYVMIGGMPEVVSSYIENERSILPLKRIYSSIWDVYKDDIEKYGSTEKEKMILRHILQVAPDVRDRVTFAGFGNSQYKSGDVGEAFRKLHKAGLIKLIYPTNNTALPLTVNLRRKPKIQLLDTGLLNYASGIQGMMLGLDDFNSLFKGYIINHVVFQELIAMHDLPNREPVFWTRENANANAEVDVIINHKNMAIPLEVKSGAKGRLRSLHEFMDRCDHSYAIRLLANQHLLETSNTRSDKSFNLLSLPYYNISNLGKWVDWMVNKQN